MIQDQNEIYQITQELAKAQVEGDQIKIEELKLKLDSLQSTQSTDMI